MSEPKPIPNLALTVVDDIGVGGAGCLAAQLLQQRRASRICHLLGLAGTEAESVKQDLRRICPAVFIDSDAWNMASFEPRFAGEGAEIAMPPPKYQRLTSPSGRTLIDKQTMVPFQHLARWKVGLEAIKEKGAQSEAESVRTYGTSILLVNIRRVWTQLENSARALRSAAKSSAWSRLIGKKVTLEPNARRFNVFFSTAGGQGSGAIVAVLGLLALLIEDNREQCVVNLHLLLPGFHPTQSEVRKFDELKTWSVLRDLALLKVKAPTLHLPFPIGDKHLTERHTSQLFDELFLHEPTGGALKEGYKSFIHRVGETALGMELSAFAEDLRRTRSNAGARARVLSSYVERVA